MSNQPEISQMKRKALEAELARARELIFDLERHLANAIPFYGYTATIEDLKEENYALQRRCVDFRVKAPNEILMKWLYRTFEELLRSKGLTPGQDREIDEIGEFLGFERWTKIKTERIS